MTLGERIKLEREARGWTRADLAQRAGLTAPYISMLESGKRGNPNLDTLRQLAAALGVTVADLEGEADPAAGPWPDATIRPLGLSDDFLAKYRRLWPHASLADRRWMLGF